MKETLTVDDIYRALALMDKNDKAGPRPIVVTQQQADRFGITSGNPSYFVAPDAKLQDKG